MSRAGERAQESGRRHFLSVAASILLKKKSDSITAFVGHYNRQQTMDDKATLVNKLLQFLFGQVIFFCKNGIKMIISDPTGARMETHESQRVRRNPSGRPSQPADETQYLSPDYLSQQRSRH